MLGVSFTEKITTGNLIQTMLGRFYLSTDRSDYTERDVPVAVLTVMVDGRNTGSDDPKVLSKL